MGFSYSGISTAYSCYRKYQHLYIDKLQVMAPDSADLHFGTAMHMSLQCLLEKGTLEEAIQCFQLYWGSLQRQDVRYGRYDWNYLATGAPRVLERFQRLHLKHFTEIRSQEERLYGKLGEIELEGTPDVLCSYQGIPSIIDFKTSGGPYPKECILINEQMPLYAHLAAQSLQYNALQVVYYVFVKSDFRIQVQTYPINAEFLKEKLDNIKLMCNDLSTRKEFPKNRRACMVGTNRCEFFEKCYANFMRDE